MEEDAKADLPSMMALAATTRSLSKSTPQQNNTLLCGAVASILNEIDGIHLSVSDLILVKDQKHKSQNGLYKVLATGDKMGDAAWLLEKLQLKGETIIHVLNGIQNENTRWSISPPPLLLQQPLAPYVAADNQNFPFPDVSTFMAAVINQSKLMYPEGEEDSSKSKQGKSKSSKSKSKNKSKHKHHEHHH
jgi:hypothetical protein